MSELASRAASPEGVEFRGHHFGNLIVPELWGPSGTSDALTEQMQQARGGHTSNTLDIRALTYTAPNFDSPSYGAAYAIDLIGDTARQTKKFHRKVEAVFSQLQNAHPLTPVTFTTKPDAFCDSCIFGYHCARPTIAAGDAFAIDTLGWVSDGLQLKDQVEISGSKNDDSYKLATSLKVVRVMMGLFAYANPDNPAEAFRMSYSTPTYEPFAAARANGGQYPAYNRPWDPQYYVSSPRG